MSANDKNDIPEFKIENILPSGDGVLLELIIQGQEFKSSSGLLISSSNNDSKGEVRKAKVIATGPGGFSKDGNVRPMNYRAGDVVILQGYGGTPICFDPTNPKKYIIVNSHDILAKVDKVR